MPRDGHVQGPRNLPSDKHSRKGRKPSERMEETIMVRLNADVGRMPRHFLYLLPLSHGRALIRQRLASVALNVTADVVMTEDDFDAAMTP